MNAMRSATVAATAALTLALFSATPASAQSLALDLTGLSGSSTFLNTTITLGWAFTVNSPVTVTGLGFWDEDSDGLGGIHDVAIWSTGDTTNPLASAVIPSGTAATLVSSVHPNGDWRFVSLNTAVPLAQGDYVIAAFWRGDGGDTVRDTTQSISTASEISFVESRFSNSVTFEFPESTGPDPVAYFGPTFQIASSAAPEPGTVGFVLPVIAGIALTAGKARRRK